MTVASGPGWTSQKIEFVSGAGSEDSPSRPSTDSRRMSADSPPMAEPSVPTPVVTPAASVYTALTEPSASSSHVHSPSELTRQSELQPSRSSSLPSSQTSPSSSRPLPHAGSTGPVSSTPSLELPLSEVEVSSRLDPSDVEVVPVVVVLSSSGSGSAGVQANPQRAAESKQG